MSLAFAATEGCGGVCGLSVVCTATGEHAQAHVMCCYKRPCGSPWSLFLLIVKGQGALFDMALMTRDSQLRNRDIEGLCDNPNPHAIPLLKKVTV